MSILNTRILGYYNRFKNDDEKSGKKVIESIFNWTVRERITFIQSESDWIIVMNILQNVLGGDIEPLLFYQVHSTADGFDKERCLNLWNENRIPVNRHVNLGTLIYLAKKNGWIPSKSLFISTNTKNNYCVCALEESNVRLKYNELTKQLYYSEAVASEAWTIMNDRMGSIIELMILEGSIKKDNFFSFLLCISPVFNPVKAFLKSLPVWDNIDHIAELFSTLQLKDKNNEGISRILLRKWLISVVNGMHNSPENSIIPSISSNENLLILIGDQGIGKTRWMNKLIPDKWNALFAEKSSFNFTNNDDKLLTCEKVIILMDELAPLLNDKTTNEQLKGFLSQKTFNIRVAYGRFNEAFYKIASFIGTSNHSEIITDPTGSRRFWPIEITGVDYTHKVNMDQLWAQVYQLWRNKEQHWLSFEDQAALNKYNQEFTKFHPYEEYINRFIEKGQDTYTATEIAEFINNELNNSSAINVRQFGVYLKKAGYVSKVKWNSDSGGNKRVYENIMLLSDPNKKKFSALNEKTRKKIKAIKLKEEQLTQETGEDHSVELFK